MNPIVVTSERAQCSGLKPILYATIYQLLLELTALGELDLLEEPLPS
jgi:hypothetical protein